MTFAPLIFIIALAVSSLTYLLMGGARGVRPREMVRRLRLHIGRRGAFLAFLALLDLSYGSALLQAAVAPLKSRPDLLLPQAAWGWIWISVGIVCASGIAMRRDVAQFAIAATLKAAWGLLYFDLWLVHHLPDGWVSVCIWLAFALIVLLTASWPEFVEVEPPEPPELPEELTSGH